MAEGFTPRISLDMDGVLTIASPNALGKIAPIRAGTRAFLQSLKSKGYEVVVYTAYKPLGGAREYLLASAQSPPPMIATIGMA
jgi:hydroxymethylpyrimidine pyrophosphatase-like HAD family hydrolase